MLESNRKNILIMLAACSLLLIVGWMVYAPGTGGDFLLDDRSNLDGLKQVTDGQSALQFVFSGTAGPIGRPLALATFLPQSQSLESGASPLIAFNIVLHMLNAALLAWFFHRLSLAREVPAKAVCVITVSATAIWLFMPLLASSSLMVIQRMTTLSATFSILGLIAYLYARHQLDRNPPRALTSMALVLGGAAVLSSLAKENGILLPVLALALEATVLNRPNAVRANTWRAWQSIFLLAPTVLIAAYLLLQIPYDDNLVLRRNFTGLERLTTEAVVLWEYLINAFIPRPGMFGPFHDGHTIYRSLADPIVLAAVAGWVITLTLAFTWRRRYPLLGFAVFWYLGGHILESTTLPIEVYFEHRNYLPIVGPVYALCAIACDAPAHRLRLVYAGLFTYVAVSLIVLFGLTSLWGQPPLAAHYWQQKFPQSLRAKTTAAGYPISEDWAQKTLAMLNQLAKDRPDASYVKIQELDLACVLAPDGDHSNTIKELESELGNAEFTYSAITMISNLTSTIKRTNCNGVGYDKIHKIATALHDNRRYRNDGLYNQKHQQLLARLAVLEGDDAAAIAHLEKAIDILPTPDLNMMVVTTLVDNGDFDRAHAFVSDARDKAPWHPLKRYVWQSRLDGLDAFIDEVELRSATNR